MVVRLNLEFQQPRERVEERLSSLLADYGLERDASAGETLLFKNTRPLPLLNFGSGPFALCRSVLVKSQLLTGSSVPSVRVQLTCQLRLYALVATMLVGLGLGVIHALTGRPDLGVITCAFVVVGVLVVVMLTLVRIRSIVSRHLSAQS